MSSVTEIKGDAARLLGIGQSSGASESGESPRYLLSIYRYVICSACRCREKDGGNNCEIEHETVATPKYPLQCSPQYRDSHTCPMMILLVAVSHYTKTIPH